MDNQSKKYCILLYILFSIAAPLWAQRIIVNAPSQVAVEEQFRIQYVINVEEVESFRMGALPEGLEVLMGPTKSVSSSVMMVNGHTTSSSSVTYTYIFYPHKPGTYIIPAVSAIIKGNNVTSQSVKIQVTGTAHAKSTPDENLFQPTRPAGTPITEKDLFIKVTASKKTVSEQEAVLLTYKVYTQVDLVNLDYKMPDLKGVHIQEIQLPRQKTFSTEKVNGRTYRTVIWGQYMLYPQVAGKLDIPSLTFKGTILQRIRNIDPFESFFNGGSDYIEVKKDIKSPGLSIQVKPLQGKPENFSGGVGEFEISAKADKMQLEVNNPLKVIVVVKGKGNLKLLKTPAFEAPEDFETYDPTITENTKLTTSGLTGEMTYETLVIPRNSGEFTIKPIEFIYFDTKKEVYVTKYTDPIKVKVLKGRDSKEKVDADVDALDIRPMKTEYNSIASHRHVFYGKMEYWVILALLLITFFIMLIIFRKKAVENGNLSMQRMKRANKMVKRRLRKARTLMNANSKAGFYEETLRALWGYISDKLEIPIEQLSRETVIAKLGERHVDDFTIDLFIRAIDESEYQRYARTNEVGDMKYVYSSAETAIMSIEDSLKNKTKQPKNAQQQLKLLLLLVLMPLFAAAHPVEQAQESYKQGNYQRAIVQFEEVLKQKQSAEDYYNLGNAYYRSNQLAKAVLSYERAYKLNPIDEDIRHNLQFIRTKVVDKQPQSLESIPMRCFYYVCYQMGIDHWAIVSLMSLLLVLLLLLGWFFSKRLLMRKVCFFSSLFFIVLFTLSIVSASYQANSLRNRDKAIIISPSLFVHKTPSKTSAQMFELHEGTRVEIVDCLMDKWIQIQTFNGKRGWVLKTDVEEI